MLRFKMIGVILYKAINGWTICCYTSDRLGTIHYSCDSKMTSASKKNTSLYYRLCVGCRVVTWHNESCGVLSVLCHTETVSCCSIMRQWSSKGELFSWWDCNQQQSFSLSWCLQRDWTKLTAVWVLVSLTELIREEEPANQYNNTIQLFT